jgi:hypothetical protein
MSVNVVPKKKEENPIKKKPVNKKSPPQDKNKRTYKADNREIFQKIESCPFCGSHIGHIAVFGSLLSCNICKTAWYYEEKK